MYRRILVPLDGSEPAEAALSYAEALARASDGTIYLLRAAAPDDQAAADRYLMRLAADLAARGLAAETLPFGVRPADAVVEAATQVQIDLVVMATHGRTGLARSLQGSVADAVLHRAPMPLLLVRLGHPAPVGWPRRVLVPLDGSDLAEGALDHAVSLLGSDVELVLYQAVLPEAAGMVRQLGEEPIWTGLLTDAEGEAQAYLDSVAARQRTTGRRVRTVAEFGEPAAGITDYCHREQVDLIVLSSHGRAGLRRWLLGSVADDLLRLAPAPLLVLRPLLDTAEMSVACSPSVARPRPEPQVTLGLTERQVRLLRTALDRLLHDPAREAALTPELRALAGQLDAAPLAGGVRPPVVAPALDHDAIQPGYPVFARHADPAHDADVGQFVGVVDDVLERRGIHYLRVRGGLEQARELFLPLDAVRLATGHQVRLNLTPADLVGPAWHQPPWAALRAS